MNGEEYPSETRYVGLYEWGLSYPDYETPLEAGYGLDVPQKNYMVEQAGGEGVYQDLGSIFQTLIKSSAEVAKTYLQTRVQQDYKVVPESQTGYPAYPSVTPKQTGLTLPSIAQGQAFGLPMGLIIIGIVAVILIGAMK